MLEQLRSQVASQNVAAANKQKAQGLIQNATGRLVALGVSVATADGSVASSVQQAIGIARVALSAQSFASAEAKWRALGELDRLATEITAALNS